MITVLGADVTEGQEVKLGGRWRTLTELGSAQDDTRLAVTVDVSGRVRTAKLLLKTWYPVRRGAVSPGLRFYGHESASIRNGAGHIVGTGSVTEDDGGPVVRFLWRTNALGLDVPRREQNVDRARLGMSYGQLQALEDADLTKCNTEG